MSRSNSTNTLERCRRFLSKSKNSFRGKYQLYTGETLNGLQVIIRLERLVLPVIFPWILFCGGYGFLISLLHYFGLPIGFTEESDVITGAVLSFNIGLTLLLVFRTNQHDRNCLNIYQLTALHKLVDELVDILGGCERILKTPLPLIYSIILRKLVVLYCLILPLEIVRHVHWLTGIVTAFVSFTLLSIEEIGSEIEEPFGHDPNDLPLDVICNTMLRNVEELIRLAPSSTCSYRI